MGTSGAYGGSGSQSWGAAQDSVAGLPATGPASSAQVAVTVSQIAAAIARQFPTSQVAPNYVPSSLLGRSTSRPGTVTSGTSRSTSGGMSAGASARGAAALWAGHAALDGSQSDLDALGLGLRLEALRDLSDSDRCQYILDQVLGAPGSLDEEVLRRAALDALKDLMRQPGRTIEDSVSAFMSAYVYETALVELTSHKASLKLTPDQVLAHEKRLKDYIGKHVKFSGVTEGPRISVSRFLQTVGEYRDKVLNFLRKLTS